MPKGNPGILKGGRASNLTAQEIKFINERFNDTGKPFAKWWPSLTSGDRLNHLSAFDRFQKSAKAIKNLRDKGFITSSELNKFLDEKGRTSGSAKDFIKNPAYKVLKPKVVEGIYASTGESGKVRDTWFKKPDAQQTRNILKLHSGKGGGQGGMKPKTIEAVKKLHKDKKFVNLLASYKDGDDIPDSAINKIFSVKGTYNPYIVERYSAVLNGDEVIPGIKINKVLAKKLDEGIDFSIKGAGWRGRFHEAARNKAVRQFDKIFNPDKNPGKNFLDRQKDIQKLLKKYGLKGLSVDEIFAIRTGGTAGQSPYSIFTQIIKDKANTQAKVEIDAATSRRAIKLNEAIKAKDTEAIERIREGQRNHVKNFRIRNPEFKNISLPEDFRVGESPIKVLGEERFKTLPVEARKAMRESFKKTQFTPDLGKNLLTQKEILIKLAGTNANNVCSIFQKGGRMRFAEGSGCAGQMALALDEDPIGTATKAKDIKGTGGAVNRVKNAATAFLKFVGLGKEEGVKIFRGDRAGASGKMAKYIPGTSQVEFVPYSDKLRGRFFTTSKKVAEQFADDPSKIKSLTIPQKDFNIGTNLARRINVDQMADQLILPRSVINKLKDGTLKYDSPAFRNILRTLGKGKVFTATAAVGAGAGALVKQFRNDDPTTYLTNDKQANAMILDTADQLEREERQAAVGDAPELLDEANIGAELGVTAAAIPGSKKVFDARKKKGFGAVRAGLGPVGKALSGFATPLGIAATTPLNVASQVYAGDSVEDIATNPLNYLGPAFASTLTKEATVGMPKGGMLNKALRLGMSPAGIRGVTKFLGLPGLALSLGYEGYDQYKKYTEGRGFVYNLLNKDE